MKLKRNEIYWIIIFSILLLALNYSWLDKSLTNFISGDDFVFIDKVIDGDTIKFNGTSIRLLGINSPEKKEKYYQEAKDFLEEKVLNKTVRLEYGKDKKDRYGRILAYIFVNGENVNLESVEKGLANYYFPSGKDVHYNEFKEAWKYCDEHLCEKSKDVCANCIELKDLNYNSQEVVFFNQCNFDCSLDNWEIKDEGRKKFYFPNFVLDKKSEVKIKIGEEQDTSNILFWDRDTYVWTKTGDTLFLRDGFGKLVLWRATSW